MTLLILSIAVVVSLASASFPPGVDPRKCPNYPYCNSGNVLLPRPPKQRVQYVTPGGQLLNTIPQQQHFVQPRPQRKQLVRYVSPDGTPLGPPVPAGSPPPKLVRYVTPDGRPLGGPVNQAPQFQPQRQVQYQPQIQQPQFQVQRPQQVRYVQQRPQPQFSGQRQVVRYL